MGVFDPVQKAEAVDETDPRDAGDDADELPPLQTYETQALSKHERAELAERSRPSGGAEALTEPESAPLPPALHAQRGGAPLAPAASYALQASSADGSGGVEEAGLGVSFSPDGQLVALACRSGQVRVLSAAGELRYTLGPPAAAAAVPHPPAGIAAASSPAGACTAVRWRGEGGGGGATRNVLFAAIGDRLVTWHATTGQQLGAVQEEGNQILALAARVDGGAHATAGTDGTVRVYDGASSGGGGGVVTAVLGGRGAGGSGAGDGGGGHTSNVYSLAWHPDQPQVLLSGGWDRTVQFWDLRAGAAVRSCFGAYLCGDALDVTGTDVLTGSWREEHPLQLWDFGSGRLRCNLPFHQPPGGAVKLYAARFGRGGAAGLVACGGSGLRPFARILKQDGSVVGTLETTAAVHAVDSSPAPSGRRWAVGCADGVQLLE